MKPQRRPTREDWRARQRRMIRPKVEHDVPLPQVRSRYAFEDMGHGDSVWVPWSSADRRRREAGGKFRAAVVSAGHQWVNRNLPGWECITRTEGEGTRVWFVDPTREGET